MIGCLKFVGFWILGFIYLVFLAVAPRTAIILGAITLVGYILWSKQQKVKAVKEAESQRKRAIEQRKKAISLARKREDLYKYDPSIQPSHKRSTKNIFENPTEWAESIKGRYEMAQKHIQDAELVINDDIEEFSRYRKQLQMELIPKYENAISPYFSELYRRDEDIPTPRELKVAVEFVYPSDLQPSAIHTDLTGIAQSFSRNIVMTLQGKNITKLQKGDVASIAIAAAISGIFYLFTASQQRTKLEKLQADVDLVCEQISGAIRTYGRASEEIKHLKFVHEVAVNYMMRHLDLAIQLSSQGKKFSDLQETEQKAVETCYRGGESLKKIIQQDVINPINRST